MHNPDAKLATIFGGSGFIGTQLVQELARAGWRVRVAVRRPELAGHVRMFGFPGQIHPVQANIRNAPSVMRAAMGSDAVINLTGILAEGGRQRFRAVHAVGAGYAAQAAREAGAAVFVQMSALGANPDSPSAYQRSKAIGETMALAAFPKAVIIRPSLVFGPEDGFFNRFGAMARALPALPLIGAETRYQPIYVGDVADALAAATEGKVAGGKTYELGGPEIVTMREIMEAVLRHTHRDRPLVDVPPWAAKALAIVARVVPSAPLTPDQVIQLGIDNVVSDAARHQKRTLAAFGIDPTPMEAVLPNYLWRFRKHGQFDTGMSPTTAP